MTLCPSAPPITPARVPSWCLGRRRVRPCLVPLTAQNLLHLSSFRQLVDELVEVASFSCQRILDLLDAVAADRAGDQLCTRIQRRLFEKGRKRGLLFDQPLKLGLVEPRQPFDDPMELLPGSPFHLDFRDVMRVNGRKGHFRNALVVCGGCAHVSAHSQCRLLYRQRGLPSKGTDLFFDKGTDLFMRVLLRKGDCSE